MSNIEIDISDNPKLLSCGPQLLRKTVLHVLQRLECRAATVSLAVVDNQTIRWLQKKFLDQSDVTDVLSFDLGDSPGDEGAPSVLDCEVIVNAERALEVARSHNADPLAELNLYVVHGLLHQLGFDDQTPSQARIMHEKEDQLLQELGFGRVYSHNE